MGVGDGEEDWNSESGEDDGDCERCDDDVDLIETTSPAADSPKSILHLSERRVRKHKEILGTEVAKNGSVVDLWFRDKVNTATWDKNLTNFPYGKKCMSQHKWMQLSDDTTSDTPIRYQQYGITLKLNPNKEDMLNRTYNNKGLDKMLPQLWVCCVNYGCNAVYDVNNANDTQRNVHLSQHHILGVTPIHGREALHHARLGTMEEGQ